MVVTNNLSKPFPHCLHIEGPSLGSGHSIRARAGQNKKSGRDARFVVHPRFQPVCSFTTPDAHPVVAAAAGVPELRDEQDHRQRPDGPCPPHPLLLRRVRRINFRMGRDEVTGWGRLDGLAQLGDINMPPKLSILVQKTHEFFEHLNCNLI